MESAVRVETPNYEYFFMCPELSKKKMVPIYGRVRARTLEEFGELMRHAGEEFIFVLSGRVQVVTEFYEPVILDPGQCVYIDSGMGHAYLLAPGCQEASLIAGCTSEDEKLIDSLARSRLHDAREVPRALAAAPEKPMRKSSRSKPQRR